MRAIISGAMAFSKLKCCLAYEYDTYVDARKEFPRLREPLQALDGEYYLVKTDILAGTCLLYTSTAVRNSRFLRRTTMAAT